MEYNYKITLKLKSGKEINHSPEVVFYKEENTYGNGFYMIVDNCGFDPSMNLFDCRYDRRLNPKRLNEYFPIFARDMWTGENGSAKLIEIKEVCE